MTDHTTQAPQRHEVAPYGPSETVEIERIQDAEIVDGDEQRSWEERVQFVMDRKGEVLDAHFEVAREFDEVRVVYGQGSIEKFAGACQVSRSMAYAYRGIWREWGADWGAGELPPNLYWTHYVDTFNRIDNSKERREAISNASEKELNSRQNKKALEGKDAPKNVEMVHMLGCPECGSAFRMRDAKSWEEEA